MFFETFFGLAMDGKTNSKGLPNLLSMAVIMQEYAEEMRLARPPARVQRALFAPLAILGRRLGYRGWYPEYTSRTDPETGRLSPHERAAGRRVAGVGSGRGYAAPARDSAGRLVPLVETLIGSHEAPPITATRGSTTRLCRGAGGWWPTSNPPKLLLVFTPPRLAYSSPARGPVTPPSTLRYRRWCGGRPLAARLGRSSARFPSSISASIASPPAWP